MAFDSREVLTTGDAVRGAFAELRDGARGVLIYIATLIAVGAVAELNPFDELDPWLSIAFLVVFFVAQYLLFDALLRKAAILPDGGRRRFFRFVGQAFVVMFGVLLATNIFVIPAFIVGARWIMAPSLLLAGRCGAMEALAESWRLTKGNTVPIAFASFVLMLVGYAAAMVVDGAGGAVATIFGASEMFGPTLLIVMNLPLVGLSVAVYRRLSGDVNELADVFA